MASARETAEHEIARERRAAPEAAEPGGPEPGVAEPTGILALQQAAGNSAANAVIQGKMTVGPAGDRFEQEADSVAASVMRALKGGGPPAGSDDDDDPGGVRRQILQRVPAASAPTVGLEGGALDDETARAIGRARGGGAPLERGLQRDMERGFGNDFSGVRVHHDAASDQAAEGIQARAFTTGNDIFFRRGAYDPASDSGKELVAHELAHVVQQGAAPVSRKVADVQRAADQKSGDGGDPDTKGEESKVAELLAKESATGGDGPDEKEGVDAKEGGEDAKEVVETTGSVPESKLSEPPGGTTAPPPGEVADASRSRGGPSKRKGSAGGASSSATNRYRVEVGELSSSAAVSRMSSMPTTDFTDKVKGNPTVTTLIAGGHNPKPFGALTFQLKAGVPSFTAKSSKKVQSLAIDVNFTWDTKYGTNNGGRTDVPSATAPVVTADTYGQIVSDLTPVKKEKSWVAPRTQYWSQAICERHEKFHGADLKKYAEGAGKKFVTKYMNKQTIELTDDERKDSDKVQAKVVALVEDARLAFHKSLMTYMVGEGLTYYSFPCEERAFGDGKKPYLELAGAVKKHGKKLAADKAKADKAASESKKGAAPDKGGSEAKPAGVPS